MNIISNRPPQPNTGAKVEAGYDAKLWLWVFALETALATFANTLDARIKRVAGGGGSSAKSYSGPFACKVDPDDKTNIIVCGNNSEEKRYWRNYVFIGMTKFEVEEQTAVPVSSNGYVYLQIDVSDIEQYTYEVVHSGSIPTATVDSYFIPLAYVNFSDNAISSITQLQYGDVILSPLQLPSGLKGYVADTNMALTITSNGVVMWTEIKDCSDTSDDD